MCQGGGREGGVAVLRAGGGGWLASEIGRCGGARDPEIGRGGRLADVKQVGKRGGRKIFRGGGGGGAGGRGWGGPGGM